MGICLTIQLNKSMIKAIERKIPSRYLDYTRPPKTNIKWHYYKIMREVVLITLYPYYLIKEGIYFYHATNRLANRKLSRYALIKILGQEFYYFSKRELKKLFSYLGVRKKN